MLSVPIAQRVEGFHVVFLRQVTKLKERSLKDGFWQKVTAEKVLQGEGTQPLQTYLGRRQATMAGWVALRPIFELFTRDTGY